MSWKETCRKLWRHQKALFRRTMYLKRARWGISILEILLPTLIITLLAGASHFFGYANDVGSYDFTSEEWDECPIGFYGPFVDRVLPLDTLLSYASYHAANLFVFTGGASIEALPDGMSPKVCTDFARAVGGKQNRVSKDSANLGELIYYIDSGRSNHATRLTYSVPGDGIDETPGFIQWLEDLSRVYRASLEAIPNMECGSDGCPTGDDLLFEAFFGYRCNDDMSTVNDLDQSECLEWNSISRKNLDGPGVSGENGPQITYRSESNLDEDNEFAAEIVHLHVDEVKGEKLEVTIRPNTANKNGMKRTNPMSIYPHRMYGRNLFYEPASLQGFYGTNHRGWLMDIEPVVSLYALRYGAAVVDTPDLDPHPVEDTDTLLLSSFWWTISAYDYNELNKTSTSKNGIPMLPWYYKGGLPMRNEPVDFWLTYEDSPLESRVEYAKLGQVFFAPACYLKNAAGRLPTDSYNVAFLKYKLMLRIGIEAMAALFNSGSNTTNPLTPAEIGEFMDFLTETIQDSVKLKFDPSIGYDGDKIPCRGEDLEPISEALSLMFMDHYTGDVLPDQKCDCSNNFCTDNLKCDLWFGTIFTLHKTALNRIVDSDIFGSLDELAVFETKEAAFPEPAGATNFFSWDEKKSTWLAYQGLSLSFVFPAIYFIKTLMDDKQKKVLPYLSVLGIRSKEYWTSHYTICVIFSIIFSFICMLFMMGVLTHPNWMLVYYGFFSQMLLLMTFSTFLSAIFINGNSAALALIVTLVVMQVLFMWMNMGLRGRGAWVKYLSVFLPGFDMSLIFRNLIVYETFTVCDEQSTDLRENMNPDFISDGTCKVEGADIDYFWESTDGVAIGWVISLGFVFAKQWGFLAHYIMNVFPNDGTPAKPWNYIFCCKKKRDAPIEIEKSEVDTELQSKWIEDVPAGDAVLKVSSVSKRFKNARRVRKQRGKYFNAVNNLSLTVNKGEIFGLLGHNGAGKTTLIDMIIGNSEPLSGNIEVDGWDVSLDPEKAKKSVGFCPQFDLLFDYMTVRQHFSFVASLKNVEDIDGAVARAADVLDLQDELDFYVNTLSGGQRRRVSVGMAVIGSPSLVILDEPTTGIDPATRRSLWKCIKKISESSAVIVTTHFMDEAEYLSDRIGIMCSGRLVASGRASFLKAACDSGYCVTISKKGLDIDASALREIISDKIKSASLRSESPSEIVYTTSFDEESDLQNFVELLEDKSSGCPNFSVNVASIEDVFLKVGRGHESLAVDSEGKPDVFAEFAKYQTKFGFGGGFSNNFLPQLTKKIRSTERNPFMLFVTWFVPAINFLMFGSMVSARVYYKADTLVPMHSDIYRDVQTIDLKSPTVYIVGDELLADCLRTLDGDGYDVVSVDSADQLAPELMVQQIDTFLPGGSEAPLFAIDMTQTDENGVQRVNFMHNSSVYTWALPIGYLDMTRCYFKSRGASTYDLKVNYQPQLPINKVDETIIGEYSESSLTMVYAMSVIFTSCIWIVQVVVDRVSKSKQMEIIAGAKPMNYWISYFIVDFVTFIPGVIILSLATMPFELGFFATTDACLAFFVSLCLYALADIPRAYVFARMFHGVVGAAGANYAYAAVIGICGLMLPEYIEYNGISGLIQFMNIFPSYALQEHAYAIAEFADCRFDKKTDYEKWKNYCTSVWDPSIAEISGGYRGFGYYALRYCTSFLLFALILAYIEYRDLHPQKFHHGRKERNVDNPDDLPLEDESVVHERDRILEKYGDAKLDSNGKRTNKYDNTIFEKYRSSIAKKDSHIESSVANNEHDVELLVARNLRKAYAGSKGCACGIGPLLCCKKKQCGRTKDKVAVDSLSFSVNRGECFGFLGMNGAGKTSTISMLIGEVPRTSGIAHFDGITNQSNMSEFYRQIGYCPQFDALNPCLTGREILRYHSKLAGMQSDKVDDYVAGIIDLLDLDQCVDRFASTYSGGNKRKLSLALAFIGNPKVVFLDEPSSGVDPVSQRMLWKMISEIVRSSNRCVVLTTHSMDESEALCDRMTIMKDGRMLCLGSATELKSSYGRGYMVEAYSSKIEESISKLKARFPDIHIQEALSDRLRFVIPKSQTRMSYLLKFLKDEGADFGLVDYSVSDISLEAIFVELNNRHQTKDFSDDSTSSVSSVESGKYLQNAAKLEPNEDSNSSTSEDAEF